MKIKNRKLCSCSAPLRIREQALETAALMLGTDKSRGYCLEMICADFLTGANLEASNPDTMLLSLGRLFGLLPHPQKREFLKQLLKALLFGFRKSAQQARQK